MLQLRDISRHFGSFAALRQINFAVNAGEIVGLLGENGAGKSTLLNIICGNLQPTSGELCWNDEPVKFASPRDATRCGIGVVHQHFMLVPTFTIAENMALHTSDQNILFNAEEWAVRIEGWAQKLGWEIDARARIENLSVGERQRVEILKALFSASDDAASNVNVSGINAPGARLLLLDEPTANLTPGETQELFNVLRDLRAQGYGVVFVSHKLNEVTSLCDRVIVLRRGEAVGERRTAETDISELASLMVGRDVELLSTQYQPDLSLDAPVRLRIENITAGTLRDFSLSIRAGEIIGLAGVDGNGQHELVEVLGSLRAPQTGRFYLNSEKNESPNISVIPADRQKSGIIASFDLAENIALQPSLRAACSRRFRFDWKMARSRTRELMARYDVRAPQSGERTLVANLSGGNAQKLVVARALNPLPDVLIAAEPTRGLDIGAMQFVHQQLRNAAAAGCAVLLISTDLNEVLQLSHRIGVLYQGHLFPDENLLPHNASRETIGALMGGAGANVPVDGSEA